MVLESNRDLVLRRLIECLSRDRTKHQVAEVTSLGLVQMTRKKLGLGLLETFSEACEVCAGRGVVVHHDPVVKHRSARPTTQRQRNGNRRNGGRGGNGSPAGNGPTGGNGNGGQAAPTGGTHVITEGVKSALAQIAASTIHPTVDDPAVVEAAVVASVEAVLDAKVEAPCVRSVRGRSANRGLRAPRRTRCSSRCSKRCPSRRRLGRVAPAAA